MSGIYAIDFGTSNTAVYRWNEVTQSPESVRLPHLFRQVGQNPPLIPSVVYINDASGDSVIVGQAVCDRGLDVSTDSRFFKNIKRGIGTTVQGFLPMLDNQHISFESLGEWFLKSIVQEIQADEQAINSLTLTVPVDSFENYRNWLGQLVQDFNIEHVRMIDEPTAAALSYDLGDRNTLLVIDFGGGTVDFSLVQIHPNTSIKGKKPLGFILKWGERDLSTASAQKMQTAQVLAKAGKNLGGADIDNWLLDFFAQKQNLPVNPLTLRLVEKLKITLSTQERATETLFNDETLESFEFGLDQNQLELLLNEHGFFATLDDLMTQVLRQSRHQGIEPQDIDAVLMVGGTAQIPTIQDWVLNYFPDEKVHKANPFGAIAEGALRLSHGIELKDFLHHSYGIRFWNRRENCHDWHPIIPEGQPYPMDTPVELVLGASVDNQPSIELVVGEMSSSETLTEVYFDGDRLITRARADQGKSVQPLNDRNGARSLACLDPLGCPGSDRIKLLFWVDQDRFLRVTVEDLLTHETLLNEGVVVKLN